MRLYMILNATEAVYQWLLFLRGKNGGIVRNRGFSQQINFLFSAFPGRNLVEFRGSPNGKCKK